MSPVDYALAALYMVQTWFVCFVQNVSLQTDSYIFVQNSPALRTISEPGCWYAGHFVTLVQGPFADFKLFCCFYCDTVKSE